VEEKIEEVKEDVNKKIAEERAKLVKAATQKGDQLIAGAEKQAANLNKQATAGSDKIIEEAKAKTDKLYKEAGSNPIKKKAAELAAGKINKEVAKKAQVVIGQGDAKGKALIEKAELQKQNLIKEAKNKEIKI
jgi:cell division septum initiation protein DivIVA